MPIFHYICRKCGKQFDLFQRITDEPLKACSYCGGRANRLEKPLPPPSPSLPTASKVIQRKKVVRKKRAAKKVRPKTKKRSFKKGKKK